VAAIHFIVSNAAKYDVDEQSLSQEIQQLGLPKDNADVISSSVRDNKDSLRARYAEESYRVSKVLSSSWRIDQLLSTGDAAESSPECLTHIKLVVDINPQGEADRVENVTFELSEDKLDLLIQELSQAQKLLEI